MAEGKRRRIDWTTYEESEVYRVFTELVDQKKIEKPIPQKMTKEGSFIMTLFRQAQLVLPSNRQRPLSSIDAISASSDLAQRLILNGYVPKNFREFYKRGSKAKMRGVVEPEVDPKDTRIAELEAQLQEANQKNIDLLEQNEGLIQANLMLRNQPTPAQMLQKFVAETLAMALTMAEDAKKPAGVRLPGGQPSEVPKASGTTPFSSEERRVKEELPEFERDRRRRPEAYQAMFQGVNEAGKPRFALVADFTGGDKQMIHQECREIADLRYIDSDGKFQGLKQFNANAGRIVLWTDHAPHDWEAKLKNLGVSFHRHRGASINTLIQYLKDTVGKTQGLK